MAKFDRGFIIDLIWGIIYYTRDDKGSPLNTYIGRINSFMQMIKNTPLWMLDKGDKEKIWNEFREEIKDEMAGDFTESVAQAISEELDDFYIINKNSIFGQVITKAIKLGKQKYGVEEERGYDIITSVVEDIADPDLAADMNMLSTDLVNKFFREEETAEDNGYMD
jgi:hypothetical protein